MAVLQRLQDRRAEAGRGQAVAGRGGPSPDRRQRCVGDPMVGDGGDVDHLIVEAGCISTTTIFDHETGDVVDHLSDSLVRRAVYGPWPSCTTIPLLKI